MSDNSSSGGGIGITMVAIVVLVVLKLAEVEPIASWSWLGVIFIPILVVVGFWILVFGVLGGVLGLFVGGGALATWWGARKIQKPMDETEDDESEKT